MAQGLFLNEGDSVAYTMIAAGSSGDVIQLPGGKAGVLVGDYAIGDLATVRVKGVATLTKSTSIAFLVGGDVYWDVSASKANYTADSGTPDFYVGIAEGDQNAAATTVDVRLNERASYRIDILGVGGAQNEFTDVLTGASTLTARAGGKMKANIIATSEAEAVSILSDNAVPVSAKPIFEARVNRVAASGAASDFDFGLASAASTSDFEAVTTFAAFHLDGGDNNILTHSDDNTTDRPPFDSTLDDVSGTFGEYWIDARDPANVQFYVNGVLITLAQMNSLKRVLADGTATLKAIAMVEKTTGTETAEMQVSRLRVRTQTE